MAVPAKNTWTLDSFFQFLTFLIFKDFVAEASKNLKKVVDIVIAVGVNMKKEVC